MRGITNIIGILLIVFGIIGAVYQGFTYTQNEKVAQIGDVKITADKEKDVYISPLVSSLSVVAGAVLVLISRRGGTPS